jgi:hypothetical protein
MKHWLPAAFVVPQGLSGPGFELRPLSIDHVDADLEAVLDSAAHLHEVFPSADWPTGLTRRQNLVELGWHENEFQRRRSFAYTVLNLEHTRVIGCVYVNPSTVPAYDAVVTLWARQSELACGLEERLVHAVRAWLASDWPFAAERVAWPGREIPWPLWERWRQEHA